MSEQFAKGMEGIPLFDIVELRDVDVLCGRGGAALSHPGNQTYRKLVSLNKETYITCLKTEKLKISRSIVATIREQKGRFLDRDGNQGTWSDIGDKKAIEKTSQALREGQPKLRQQIVERGVGHAAMGMDYSVGGGMFNPALGPPGFVHPGAFNMQMAQQQMAQQQMAQRMAQQQMAQQQMAQQQMAQQQMAQRMAQQQLAQHQQQIVAQQQMAQQQMVQHPTVPMAPTNAQEINQGVVMNELMMEQLNLNSDATSASPRIETHKQPQQPISSIPQQGLPAFSMQAQRRQVETQAAPRAPPTQMHPYAERQMMRKASSGPEASSNQAKRFSAGSEGGMPSSQEETGQNSQTNPSRPPLPARPLAHQTLHEHQQAEPHSPNQAPRQQARWPERIAENSYDNSEQQDENLLPLKSQMRAQQPSPPSVPTDSHNPPAHMDRRRLFARMKYSRPASGRLNRSNRSLGDDGMPDIHMVGSLLSLMSNLSNQEGKSNDTNSLSKNSDHKMRGEDFILGSRRSIMSGLSKISDASNVDSIFSDLSRKIGNVSTRSIAMSEISGIEEGHQEDLEESYRIDRLGVANSAQMPAHMQLDT